MKVAILQIVLGSYEYYWQQFLVSSEKYFCKDCIKHYFVFTDNSKLISNSKITYIKQDFLGWPFSTLSRYQMFLRIFDKLELYDSTVFFNANTKFVQDVSYEQFFGGNNKKLLAGLHPFFKKKSDFPTEKRKESRCYLKNPSIYVQGCVNGGDTKVFLEEIKKMNNLINKDLANGILAIWHDESYWNLIVNDYYKNKKHELNLLGSDYLCTEDKRTKTTKIIQLIKNKDYNFQKKQFDFTLITLIKFTCIKFKNILMRKIRKSIIYLFSLVKFSKK